MSDQPLSSQPDPREWLRFAQNDLNAARRLAADPEILPNAVAFHAHQAVEKAVKGLLIDADTQFPFTHDLRRLFELYHREGRPVPFDLAALNALTPYAGHRRYPGWMHQPDQTELRRLLTLAE